MRRLMLICIVALGVAVFWVAATTYPAPSESVYVPDNRLRTGALHLDLSGGSGSADLSVPGLLPGDVRVRRFWLAANDASSVTAGALELRLDDLRDVAGPCATSADKARAVQQSGIGGCRIAGGSVSGTPDQGNLSRLLSVQLRSAVSTVASSCDTGTPGDVVVAGVPGNLRAIVGHPVALTADAGRPGPVLAPGQGLCLTVEVGWPPNRTDEASADRDHPLDNAAQGDTLRLRAVFTLTQVSQ